jgi:hypothetical protein
MLVLRRICEWDEVSDVHVGVFTGYPQGLFGLHVLCRRKVEAQKGLRSRNWKAVTLDLMAKGKHIDSHEFQKSKPTGTGNRRTRCRSLHPATITRTRNGQSM